METTQSLKYLRVLVIVTCVSVTLSILPRGSIDPMNLPKLIALTLFGFLSGGLALSQAEFWSNRKNRAVTVLVISFVTQLFLVFILDSRDFAVKFYGIHGRNTGLLAYLALTFMLFASAIASNKKLLIYLSYTLISTGALLGVYGIFQANNLDLFKYDNIYASNVFGTFGNPNFQSAFMGIAGAAGLALLAYGGQSLINKVCLLVVILIAGFNITKSSEQGFLTIAAGFWASTTLYVYLRNRRNTGHAFLSIGLVAAGLVLLGILNKGPFAEILFKSSLQARGFYWRAALQMMESKPFTGVGMDGFGDWYRRSRSVSAAISGPETVADSSHNVLLDIGSSGGIPLLIIYLILIVITLLSIYRFIKSSPGIEPFYIAVVGAWVAYQAQSLISINQLGLGIWGWVLTGAIIGYGRNSLEPGSSSSEKMSKQKQKQVKLTTSAKVTTLCFGLIATVSVMPVYLGAHGFYQSLVSANPDSIIKSIYREPHDRFFFIYVARVMLANQRDKDAIEILQYASQKYPDSTEIWQVWTTVPTVSPSQLSIAKAELKRLDPHNPNLN
jgi:O-antigen ligase